MTNTATQNAVRQYAAIVRNVFLKYGGGRIASALYVIGGFAHSEGACDQLQNGIRIYNDLDFLVIVPRKDPARLLRLNKILQHLNDGRFDFQVDLVILSEADLSNEEPLILRFDIRMNHIYVWGKDILTSGSLPPIDAGKISKADTLQLLLNRQASLLIGLSLLDSDKINVSYLQVQLSKPLSAMLAAVQIMEGEYSPATSCQLDWMLSRIKQKANDSLWKPFLEERMLKLLEDLREFKQVTKEEHFAPFDENARYITKQYFSFLRVFIARHYGLSEQTSLTNLIKTMRERQPQQWDPLAPTWWAAFIRSGFQCVKPRFMRQGPHLHVDAYAAQLSWMYNQIKPPEAGGDPYNEWHKWLPWYNSRKSESDLKILIHAWKISSYGCQLH